MSPNIKKILLIGGAAVAGFVAYKVIKGRSKPAALTSSQLGMKLAMMPNLQISKMASKVAGIEEELGVAEDLGSLGGGF
jgi:hypothetical protein